MQLIYLASLWQINLATYLATDEFGTQCRIKRVEIPFMDELGTLLINYIIINTLQIAFYIMYVFQYCTILIERNRACLLTL